jgi:hypothetical protein
MKKYPILLLLPMLCLTSCDIHRDSFHSEFYHDYKNSYLTFTLKEKTNEPIAPGTGQFADYTYESYLNFYFDEKNNYIKELTYKKRDGYVAIYFKKNSIDYHLIKSMYGFDINEPLSSIDLNSGLGVYDICSFYGGLNIMCPSIEKPKSRLIFKDFSVLSDEIYNSKHLLVGLISYVDVYEGDNKLLTTYYHYSLDDFKPVNFYQKEIYYHPYPPESPTKTFSIFPYEGEFLNYYYEGEIMGNFFSNKYLNTYFPMLNENYNDCYGLSLSNFRFEILREDQRYLLIPTYAVEENPESWGRYLETINSFRDNLVYKNLEEETISYIKVPFNSLYLA